MPSLPLASRIAFQLAMPAVSMTISSKTLNMTPFMDFSFFIFLNIVQIKKLRAF